MYEFQAALYHFFRDITFFEPLMSSRFGWPVIESLHFVGLSMLIGAVGMFDLRLLGMARSVSFTTLHKLVPFGVAGYLTNVCTGFLFLTSAPDQYIYNSAFHMKMLFMLLAGLNVATFYSATFRHLKTLGPNDPIPFRARLAGGASLALWTGIIIFGRLITFYRPFNCLEGEPIGFLATCF